MLGRINFWRMTKSKWLAIKFDEQMDLTMRATFIVSKIWMVLAW